MINNCAWKALFLLFTVLCLSGCITDNESFETPYSSAPNTPEGMSLEYLITPTEQLWGLHQNTTLDEYSLSSINAGISQHSAFQDSLDTWNNQSVAIELKYNKTVFAQATITVNNSKIKELYWGLKPERDFWISVDLKPVEGYLFQLIEYSQDGEQPPINFWTGLGTTGLEMLLRGDLRLSIDTQVVSKVASVLQLTQGLLMSLTTITPPEIETEVKIETVQINETTNVTTTTTVEDVILLDTTIKLISSECYLDSIEVTVQNIGEKSIPVGKTALVAFDDKKESLTTQIVMLADGLAQNNIVKLSFVLDNDLESNKTHYLKISLPAGYQQVSSCKVQNIIKIPKCGEGICNGNETKCSCPRDCGICSGSVENQSCKEYYCSNNECQIRTLPSCCGNDVCEASGIYSETYEICPNDCPYIAICGNGVCDSNENNCSCSVDCGTCSGDVSNEICKEYYCDLLKCTIRTKNNCCGNGVCEVIDSYKESYGACPVDCESGGCSYSTGTLCTKSCCATGWECDTNEFSYLKCNLLTGEWDLTKYADSSCTILCSLDEGSISAFYCGDGSCNGDETCASCPSDCLVSGQVCCNEVVYTGYCCSDSDCTSGQVCSNHLCVEVELECSNTITSCCSDADCTSYCNGLTRHYSGTCTTIGSACSYLSESCDDEDACTINTCLNGACIHEDITMCVNDDDCCPSGGYFETDNDCTTCSSGKLLCDGACVTPTCNSDSDCDDGDSCTTDTCSNTGTCSASCSNIDKLDNENCGDSNICCSGTCIPPVCSSDDSWLYMDGSCYKDLGIGNWDVGKVTCESNGAHLVVINDEAENNWVYENFAIADENLWIGYNDIAVEGVWEWLTPSSYTNWCSGEPSPSDWDEDCAQIISYCWRDLNCGHEWHNANIICEKSLCQI